ncbi:MAG: endolytic transglycosylase MltG [Spirochaetales bacterium]|nr:endolytic transglycosylase MltG [Spirochaetales bacterium]
MIKKIIIVAVIILVLAAAGTSFYIYRALEPVDPQYAGEAAGFDVESGESLYSVLSRLETQGFVRDVWIYKVYNRLVTPLNVKKGHYEILPSMTGLEILSILEEGRQELVRVTVPEGLRSSQIAVLFENSGVSGSGEFLEAVNSPAILRAYGIAADSLEGYLFPDTYYFQKDYPAEKVVSYMVSVYFENLKRIFPFYADLTPEKLQEKLILASVVEKEYRVAEEAALIASVFNNRMKTGMPLQSCATVIYVITEELGRPHPDRVFFRDLELPSEFNTYIHDGLPPAPISNPGVTALNAAFNPAQTDYLFFVVKDSAAGTHTFTSNFADHNSARASYIEGFRSK